MTTLRLIRRRSRKKRPKEEAPFNPLRPYLDRGRPGPLRYGTDGKILRSKEPPSAPRVLLTLQMLRRHNSLDPLVQPTHRILLRWGESEGSGLFDPDADRRELHFDPLPYELQVKVSGIVDGSPWQMLARKWYRTTMTGKELAEEFGVSRSRLYEDWRSSLWYFRGRFEADALHE